jgi:hypothetical protein
MRLLAKSLFISLTVCFSVSAMADPNYEYIKEDFSKFSRDEFIKVQYQYHQFFIKAERQTQYEEAEDEGISFMELLETIGIPSLINDCYAVSPPAAKEHCLFGGWVSKIRSESGKCKRPWKAKSYATQLGVEPYTPKCGGKNLFRCNPTIFGPGPTTSQITKLKLVNGSGSAGNINEKGGICVPINGTYHQLSERCSKISKDLDKDRGKSWLKIMSDQDFDKYFKENFTPMQKHVEEFCSRQPSFYEDNTCGALNDALKKIIERKSLRTAVTQVGDIPAVVGGSTGVQADCPPVTTEETDPAPTPGTKPDTRTLPLFDKNNFDKITAIQAVCLPGKAGRDKDIQTLYKALAIMMSDFNCENRTSSISSKQNNPRTIQLCRIELGRNSSGTGGGILSVKLKDGTKKEITWDGESTAAMSVQDWLYGKEGVKNPSHKGFYKQPAFKEICKKKPTPNPTVQKPTIEIDASLNEYFKKNPNQKAALEKILKDEKLKGLKITKSPDGGVALTLEKNKINSPGYTKKLVDKIGKIFPSTSQNSFFVPTDFYPWKEKNSDEVTVHLAPRNFSLCSGEFKYAIIHKPKEGEPHKKQLDLKGKSGIDIESFGTDSQSVNFSGKAANEFSNFNIESAGCPKAGVGGCPAAGGVDGIPHKIAHYHGSIKHKGKPYTIQVYTKKDRCYATLIAKEAPPVNPPTPTLNIPQAQGLRSIEGKIDGFIGDMDKNRRVFYDSDGEMTQEFENLVKKGLLTRVSGNSDGWKYKYIADDGQEYYVAEGPWTKGQFPDGLPLLERQMTFWKVGEENSVHDAFPISSDNRTKVDFKKTIEEGIEIAEENFKIQENPKFVDLVKGITLPKDKPIAMISLVQADYEGDPMFDTIMDASKDMPEILNEFGHKVTSYDPVSSDAPLQALEASIKKSLAEGVNDFYIDLSAHGSEKGMHFSADHNHVWDPDKILTGDQLSALAKKYPDANFLVNSIACHGGGFRDDIVEDSPPNLTVILQSKPYNTNEEGRDIKGNANSTYFNMFYQKALINKGKQMTLPTGFKQSEIKIETIGDAVRYADLMAGSYIHSNAEVVLTDNSGDTVATKTVSTRGAKKPKKRYGPVR